MFPTSNVNHNYFNVIDSECKAYILGFIVGDGSLQFYKGKGYLKIEIHQKDKDILEKISKEIDFKRGVSYNKRGSVYISVRSNEIFNDLVKIGVKPNKSNVGLDSKVVCIGRLFWPFLRGLFDSDGTIGIYKGYGRGGIVQGKANEKLLFRIKEILETQNVFCSVSYDRSSLRLDFYKRELRELLINLYKDSTIFMDRKRMLSLDILENQILGVDWNKIIDYVRERKGDFQIKRVANRFGVSPNGLKYNLIKHNLYIRKYKKRK